jgi:amino acid permease
VTKSRAGFVTATVALVTMACKIAFVDNKLLEGCNAAICIALGLVGFITWGIARYREVGRARAAQAQGTSLEQLAQQDPLLFLRSGKYWGVILMISAAIATGIISYYRPQPVLTVYARMSITNVVTITNFVTITNRRPVVTFPPLKLAGVVVNGPQSSAVINGRVLRLGETINNVCLVAVDPGHAFMALGGETNVLTLRR